MTDDVDGEKEYYAFEKDGVWHIYNEDDELVIASTVALDREQIR